MLMRYVGGGIGHVQFDLAEVISRLTAQEAQDDELDLAINAVEGNANEPDSPDAGERPQIISIYAHSYMLALDIRRVAGGRDDDDEDTESDSEGDDEFEDYQDILEEQDEEEGVGYFYGDDEEDMVGGEDEDGDELEYMDDDEMDIG